MSTPIPEATPTPMDSGQLDSLGKQGSALAVERQQEGTSPAPGVATPTGNPMGLTSVLSQIVAMQATLGNQGETKGPEVMLTRDVKGPSYGITYEGDTSEAGNLGLGESKSANTSYGMTKGGILEDRQDYDEYSKSGFLGNNNDRINDGVVTAAGGDPEKYESVFQAAVAQAAYIQKASPPGSLGSKTTVEDVLNGWIKNGLPDNLKSGGGGGGGSRAFTNIDTRVDLTNEGEARRIVNNALTGALGREATRAENQAFMKALNMNEKANPVVTTSKGVSSASGTTSTTDSEGGFDSLDFADRFAKSQEGYAEYQTATTYLDAFIGALESDSRVI